MKSENNIFWFIGKWLAAGLVVSLLFSCSTTKYLAEDEAFVVKNEIEIISDQKIKRKKRLVNGLSGIPQPRPNTRFMGVNRRWFYYRSQERNEKRQAKQKKRKRVIGEPPAIFRKNLAEESSQSMERWLNQQGYYEAKVDYEADIKNKKATVKYLVHPGRLFVVDTMVFVSKDTSVQKILEEISPASKFQKGKPVSIQAYDEERQRITTELRNRGYREFYINYIDQLTSTTDSTEHNNLKLKLKVFTPNTVDHHTVFKVGEVYVYPFYEPQRTDSLLKDTLIEGVHFRIHQSAEAIKPEVLLRRIFLKKGDVYQQKLFTKTVQSLGELSIFKFANIDDEIQRDGSATIDFRIYLPANQQRNIGGNLEYNNTSFSDVSLGTNLNGVETSLSYQDRNALGGSEVFSANIGFGIQIGNVTSRDSSDFIDSYNFSPQLSLNFPRYRDLLGIAKLLNNIGVFSNTFYKTLREEAQTRVSLALNWNRQRQFWGYFSTDLSLGYQIQTNPNRRYFVNQLGVNIFQPTVGADGAAIFAENPFLQRTFNTPQLFTGLLMRDFTAFYSGRDKRNTNNSWRFQINAEISGMEALVGNTLVNQFRTENRDTLQLFGLNFAQFAALDLDGSYYLKRSSRHVWAFRVNAGIAAPFGTSNDVPYVKQFFGGGPNSIRAWQIRELGPGSYQDDTPAEQTFYQTGDFKFIFSAEYRFLLFRIYGFDWEGSAFLDGGNVWTLREDPDRPGAKLTSQPWQQMALGTGVGLRINFDYFVLRWDMGYKVRNPFPDENGNNWVIDEFTTRGLRGINHNLAIGYAF